MKTLRQDIADTNREEFLREAAVMMKLNHECIVKFIGICTEPPNLLMVNNFFRKFSIEEYFHKFYKLGSRIGDAWICIVLSSTKSSRS